MSADDARARLTGAVPHDGLRAADAETRPWGGFVVVDRGPGFKVKRVLVRPGGRLSLQSHRHRTEHWYVVDGEATVTIDGARTILVAGRSIDVPVGAIHRLENFGAGDLVIVEVQRGDYLGEDDIFRYDDAYRRGETELSPDDNAVVAPLFPRN